MVFKIIESDITKAGYSLSVFGKEWNNIINDVKNAKGLNKITSAFSTGLSKDDINRLREYNHLIEKGQNPQSAYYRTLKNGSSAAQELAMKANGAAVSEEALTAATQKLTLAQRAGIAISKAFGTALNVALNVGITLAISAIITGITKLVNAEQEAKEKIEEQAKSAKQLSDDLADLRKQYYELSKEVETDSSKKEQLNSVTEELLKKLGYEKSAVADLVEEYGNLDNAINSISLSALEDAETDLKFKYTDSKNSIANISGTDSRVQLNDFFGTGGRGGKIAQSNYGNTITVTSGGSEANLGDILKEVPEIKPYYSLGILELDVSSVEKTKESIDILNKAIDSLEENIDFEETLSKSDFYNNLNAVYDDLTNNVKEYNSAVSNLNDNLAQQFIIKGLQGRELPKTKEEFDTFAESVVNASIASEQFIGSEKDIRNSIMAFLETMPEFSSFFVVEKKNVGDTTKSFSDLKEETKSLQEALDSTFSNQSTLQSAFDKIQEGTSLSADEVRKLIDLCKDSYPEITTAFTKTADGYTISANDIISANEAITKSTKEELQNQINEYQKIVDEYNSIKSDPNADRFVVSNLANKASEAKSIIDGLRFVMEMFGLTTKDLDDNYKELMDNTSKLASKAKTLSSAFAEQNENGKLSVDTVLSLIENGYAAALMYDKKTGAIRLNAQAYIDLANAEISAQIAELTLAKSNDKASQEKLEVQRDIVSNLGWSYLGTAEAALRMAEAQEKLNNADADLSKYDAQIQALNDLRDNLGNIVNGTYGVSGSTEDLNKKAFEEANNLRKHWLAMGKDDAGKKYTEDMYYAWLDSAEGYKKYFSDLTKYQEENRQYEEEIYKWKLEQDKELFQEKLDNNEKLIKEINNTEYDNPLQKYDEVAKVIQDSIDITQQRINDLVASGSGAVQDEIDSLQDDLDDLNDKLKENEKDRQKEQVDNEKSYWEWQKEQVETYYDNELKKLQEITDQEERISKQKELQLKLIKAQDDLLKAKKNRNQLVFSNGGWEYDYDQDDIISKMETVADAEKAVADNQKENQKDDLEKKKEEALAPFEDILKAISDYIDYLNGDIVPTESNPEVLDAVAKNAEQVQKDDKKRAENFTPVTLENILQNMGFKYNKEVVSAGYNLYEKVIGNSLGIPNEIAKGFSGTTYNNCTINKGISINNPSFSLIKGVSETKVRDIFDEEITNAFNIISDRIETEAIRVGNE